MKRRCFWLLLVAALHGCSAKPEAGSGIKADGRTRIANATCVTPAVRGFPAKLSAVGCFDPSDPRAVVSGPAPYEPQATLWSDGMQKTRYFAIPDGTAIHIDASGHFQFPNGTILIKSFLSGDRYVETRLFVRYGDGGWAGYSYEWNDAQTDADLLPDAMTKSVDGHVWTFPSRQECLRCHNDSAGSTLGLDVAQLDAPMTGRSTRQLQDLAAAGYFDGPLPGAPESLGRLSRYDSTDPIELRARAYLHANCAHCHRPGGPGKGPADYRFSVAFDQMHVCNTAAAWDPSRVLLVPGSSKSSETSVRMHAHDGSRMPELGSTVVDPVGTALVDGWIDQRTGCAN